MREVGSQGCAVSSGGSHIFSSARTDGGSGSGAGIDSGSGPAPGRGRVPSSQSEGLQKMAGCLVEAAKYLPSAVCRRKPWSFANVRFGGKSASESVTRQDTH